MTAPLPAYMDAVVDALMNAGIGVRDHECVEVVLLIGIDLDPVSAVRRPVMAWTPAAGWRIAMLCRGKIRTATIRYLALGMTPRPRSVARLAELWLATLDGRLLTAVEPVYAASPADRDRRLADVTGDAT